jgi:hypothetical protein
MKEPKRESIEYNNNPMFIELEFCNEENEQETRAEKPGFKS